MLAGVAEAFLLPVAILAQSANAKPDFKLPMAERAAGGRDRSQLATDAAD
ncbi:MAG: hypothetical protein ABR606_10045 [Vicinamibacterales bacterium]